MSSTAGEQTEAGRAALADGRWDEARQAFEAALALEDSGEVRVALGDALWWLGDVTASVGHRERAFALHREAGDAMQAALTSLFLALDYCKQYGDTGAARGWLAQATRLADEHDLDELRGWLLFATSFCDDDPERGEQLARDAHRIARETADHDLEPCALGQVGAWLIAQGRVDEGVACLDEAMAVVLGTSSSSPESVVVTSCLMMTSCTRCAELDRAVQWIRRTLEFTDRYGCPFLYAECRIHYGAVLLATGEWEPAERELRAGAELAATGAGMLHRLARARLAGLCLDTGRIAEAEQLVADAADYPELASIAARLHLVYGRTAAAATVLQRRLQRVVGDRIEVSELGELLGEVELHRGDNAAATSRAAELVASGTTSDCALVAARGHRLAGRAAVAVGDSVAARTHFDAAVVDFAHLGLPWEVARTRLLLAEAIAAEDPDVADAEATAVLERAERLGAGPLADQAAALLRRLGRRAARGGRGTSMLSQREEQVLSLIGEGLSNPEIAARLHLSRRTVEHHVAHVLTKLGVRNRAEAAAESVRRAGAVSQ